MQAAGGAMASSPSFFVAASNQLDQVYGPDKAILTQPFLDTCRLVLPVIGAHSSRPVAAVAPGQGPPG